MILRPATVADADPITTLELLVFEREAWSASSVVGGLTGPGRFAVVAVHDGAVVGYAVTMTSGDVVDLQRIAVHPAHRRSHAGTRLLAAVSERAVAEGAGRMLLEVSAGNAAARHLYARAGFTEVNRRRSYYRDGSDALVLGRALDHPPAEPGAGRG